MEITVYCGKELLKHMKRWLKIKMPLLSPTIYFCSATCNCLLPVKLLASLTSSEMLLPSLLFLGNIRVVNAQQVEQIFIFPYCAINLKNKSLLMQYDHNWTLICCMCFREQFSLNVQTAPMLLSYT